MAIQFAKMHGLGNDFVVFDAVRQDVELTPERIRSLADRRFGVGCDQVLLVAPPEHEGVDFTYRIYNADGGEVEQCGNGARCVAAFARAAGLTDKAQLRVETLGGPLTLSLEDPERVAVDMGAPRLDGAEIPLAEPGEWLRRPLDAAGEEWPVTAVSMGNPHAVIEVADAELAPVEAVGSELEHHPLFPNRANVGFAQVVDSGHLRVRVWERGAGVTLACGTGACAAMVAARLWGKVGETAEVRLDGGNLTIQWPGRGEPVIMTGPAELVFWGRLPDWPRPRPASAQF
jgi:diaminopimelate epimerase